MKSTREQMIEQSRIDFETYFWESRKSKGAKRAPTFLRYEHDDTYIDDHTQRHWWTWQQAVIAGRAQWLREARDAVKRRYMGDNNREDAEVLRCAAAIEQLEGK